MILKLIIIKKYVRTFFQINKHTNIIKIIKLIIFGENQDHI